MVLNVSESTPSETAEAKKPHRQILLEEIMEGAEAARRPPWTLALSGLSAGLDISFSVLLMAVVRSQLPEGELPVEGHLLVAAMYAVGFIFVVLGRTELFTEHTTLAVLPVLGRRASIGQLARLWAIVYVTNLIGAVIFSGLIVLTGFKLGAIESFAVRSIAHRMTDHSASTIFLSGILAGWLMGLLSWLVSASRDTISQIAIVALVAASIGFAGLHHAIVGSTEVLVGVMAGVSLLTEFGHFLLWTTLGNAVGGVVFVALLRFSQSMHELPTAMAERGGKLQHRIRRTEA